ncbi:MAG: precorrin-2 C(20)-methyltransferase [Bacteroidales bacterium]|nr:precorrin-2 C(20)-methyltransferase [Bacteroidales bacterium]MBN2750979.1 precorrin-2 C(20)-methyltransferase [Bacteroidales bacterium]
MKCSFSTTCVSLGPGDAELITLKALRALRDADAIFCPATQLGERSASRARDILLEIGIDERKVHLFCVPMSKERQQAVKVYADVASEIGARYQQGERIAFVAEGASVLYSSVHYISDLLAQQGVPVQHVAGVPAFIACGALAGIHVAKQNEPLVIYPANVSSETIAADLQSGRSVVLMKLPQQEEAARAVIGALPNAQFHYFENVGVAGKEFYTCSAKAILARTFPYFSVIIIRGGAVHSPSNTQ